MIYLNNAATTYPKPQRVLDAHAAALTNPPSGQFRSSGFFDQADIFTQCRKSLSALLGISDYERIFFSSGATDSANKVLLGLDLESLEIITTVTEHNSILRPLYNNDAIRSDQLHLIGCDAHGRLDLAELEKLADNVSKSNEYRYESKTEDKHTNISGIVIVNHCSNVTGMVQNLAEIGRICRQSGLIFMVDASQSAGCLRVDVDEWGIDILIMTGHKSLYGVQGTGAHYVNRNLFLNPVVFGGTGRDSSKLHYEQDEYEYEVGTQNAPGIVALYEGIQYIFERDAEQIAIKERFLMKQLYEGLLKLEAVRIFGSWEDNEGPLLSFQMKGLKPSDIAYILETGYGIAVRTGLHCAPLIHERIGSGADGTVRVSISDMTLESEITSFLQAISGIAASLKDYEM